ncbi:MAG: hypothetical protein IKX14_01930 [Neisseriaceae bacterium]|nr:hypothetical protein [Neisseriaceae bacterium]
MSSEQLFCFALRQNGFILDNASSFFQAAPYRHCEPCHTHGVAISENYF